MTNEDDESRASERRRVLDAWERFASGDNDIQGIRSSLLLSWYRCRDVYQVDPQLGSPPRAAEMGVGPELLHNFVFAQLGGIASTIVARNTDCLATVTDGDGRILASWGDGRTWREARASGLTPFYTWAESAIGTNGMGTALSQAGSFSVRGPEHWCQALHRWNCVGIAICHSVTQEPVAALNVSCWKKEVPASRNTLAKTTELVRRGLRERAIQDAEDVALAFEEADRHARGAVIAVDIVGSIIAANEKARQFLGKLPSGFMLDPIGRWHAECSALQEVAIKSTQCARDNPGWIGSADLGVLSGTPGQIFDITPAYSPGGVIGLLLTGTKRPRSDAVRIEPKSEMPSRTYDLPKRISAVRDGRVLLLSPREIRYAEAARHDVWLVTDQGRVRAAAHGIQNIERQLVPLGFMRVHRSYVINLARIREVSHHSKGVLTLSTDPHTHEEIPVSRRCVAALKVQLGL